MKPTFLSAALLACTLPLVAQDSTGTAHPEQLDDSISTQQAAPVVRSAKPSPDVPMNTQTYPNGEVQQYQPANSPGAQTGDHYVKPSYSDDALPPVATPSQPPRVIHQSVSSLPLDEQLADPSQPTVPQPTVQQPIIQTDTQSGAMSSAERDAARDGYQPYHPAGTTTTAVQSNDPVLQRHPGQYPDPSFNPADGPRSNFAVTEDPTSGVVMDVPAGPNELPATTLLRARLITSISTRTSKPGDHFTSTLAYDVLRNNRVLLPAGSTVHGRVSAAHNGHGVVSAAVLRLEAESITLPDGTTYPLHAEVVDLSHAPGAHVTSEGTIQDDAITRGEAVKLGALTGGSTVAGALVGGPVGAVVGVTVGAGVSTVLYLRRDREQTIPANAELVFALDGSVDLSPHREAAHY